MNDETDKLNNTDRKDLFSNKEENIKDRIPCLITCNRKLPMVRKIINKHWNILQINSRLEEMFQNDPFVGYKRNKNLQVIIGGHTIENGKNGKVFKAYSENREGKCDPCNTSKPSPCCKQVIDTSTFQS